MANTPEISTTKERFTRITELKSKILNIKSQLTQDESIKLSIFVPKMEDSNSKAP